MITPGRVLVKNNTEGMINNVSKKYKAYFHPNNLSLLKKHASHKMIIKGKLKEFSLVNMAMMQKK
jgi:hypothetical protein